MKNGDDTAESLQAEIVHLERLASGVTDQRTRDALRAMIEELQQRLRDLGTNSPSDG